MRIWWVLVVATIVLVSGCKAQAPVPAQHSQPAASLPESTGPAANAAAPQASSPSVSQAPAPGLRERLDGGEWCKTGLPWPERETALTAGLPAILGDRTPGQIEQQLRDESGGAQCLLVEAVNEYDALLISTRVLHAGGAVLATHAGGNWQVMPVEPSGGDWGMVEALHLGVARPPDFVFVGGISGSSGYKSLFRGRPSDSGRLKLTPASEGYWKTGFRFLGTDYVVATQLAEELGPVLETCNACQPVRQRLLHWSGNTYVEVGSRAVSTPYLAANLFLGALQAGDDERALQFASDRSIAQKGRMLTDRRNSLDRSACRNIDDIEYSNWDLLPVEFRSSLPVALSTCSLKFDSAVTLQMRREPKGWVVADITP